MSLRLIVLCISIVGLSVYAWKDWFKSLCGLVVLMAVIEHEDVPKTILGIQGLNPWNVLFVVIVLAWAANRTREGLTWDLPRHIGVLLLLYLGVILIGVARAIFDRSHIESYPLGSLISEELINTIKWVLPGLLLFDGCRTRRRVITALICLFVMYLGISAQMINRMPARSAFSGGEEIQHTRLKTCDSIGYSAAEMSTMLAGASWGLLAALPLVRKNKYRVLLVVAALAVIYAQALTGGRAGYIAWGVTGIILCLLKWRKYLLLTPVVVVLLPVVFPAAAQRMLFGFGETDVTGEATVSTYEMTSGRLVIWPYVVEKIEEAPLIGYGRLAMKRTGLADWLMSELNESFPHPHNLYMETLLDNGILGSIPIAILWGYMVVYSLRLFKSSNRLYSAIGGLAGALVLAQLLAGIGAQHVYPKESTMGMWTAMLLCLRVHVEEVHTRMDAFPIDEFQGGQAVEPLRPAVVPAYA